MTANSVYPGMVAADFARENIGFMANKGWRIFMKSSEMGAATSVYLASSPDVEGITGKYFANRRAKRSSRLTHDRELAERLRGISMQHTHHDQE